MEYNMRYFLVLVLLNFTKGLSAVEVRLSRNPIPAGENVTLEVIPPTAMQLGTWSFESRTILIYAAETTSVIPEYLHRLAFDSNTGSLTLMNVNVNDSGRYILQGFQPSFQAEVTLSVQEPVSDVRVNASATDLVEFNDTVSLTCSASGSSLSFQWLLGSSDIITGGRVQLSDGGRILTISSVLRSDRGPLYCIAYNGISNGTSQPILLNISFGPGDPEVTKNPNEAIYRAGSGVVLSCSAQSNPPASYLWEFDGRPLSLTGPELSLQNVHQNQSGNYSCLAHNSITRRYTWVQTSVTILDPISGVIVNSSGELPILDTVFTLSCEVSGPASSIQWLKDGHALVPDNRTVFSADNGLVTLSPVQRSDDGMYQCEAFNAVSNKTSPGYHLLVNYGPEQVVITGPAVAETGTNVTFSCSASSQPPSQYRWYFNSSLVAEGSVFETGPLTLASHGAYTCEASNSVTGRNSTAVKELAVVAPITAAMVNVSGGLPIQERPVTMECKVDGQADSIQWLRDGSPMMADNRTVFSADNSSVTLSPVQRSDDGSYQCEAFNAVSNRTSPGYHLLVNYGPEQVVITGPALAATGTNVTFSCSASSQPPSQYRWYFNGSQVAEGSVFETGPLTLANHGSYTCEASNSVTGRKSTAVKELTVIAIISLVTVNANPSQPILSQSVTLTCDITGAVSSIHWLKDGHALVPDNRTAFSSDNSSVTLSHVQRSDDGSYQCEAFNAVSNKTSPGYHLLVNYGPEQVVITGPAVAATGTNVTFSCSASSQPPSQYRWYFNSSQVAEGSVFETGPLTLASHGAYTCEASNSVTGRKSTAVKELAVVAVISSATITANPSQPILSQSVTLTCDITGAVSSIHWLKDGNALVPDNRMVFSSDNSSVTLSHVQRSDDGTYQCEAFNAVSNKTSPGYHLLVNYGPEQVVITGPAMAETGTNATFSCSASSQPPSQYRWYFNSSQVAEGSVFETGPLTLASHGTYTCEASNSVTGRNSTAVKELAVVAPISSVTVIPYPSIPILASNLTLTCNVTGVFKTMYWLKDGQRLTSKDNVIVNADNSSVSFVPAQLTDDGSYQCFASNLYSEKSSPVYHLLVSYGPDSVEIKGPHKVKAGTPVKLTCSAQSQPPSHFYWSFKGSETMATGNILNLAKPSAEDSGLYTCLGENPLTKVTAMATFNLTIESFAVPVMLSREGLPLIALTGLSVLLLTNWLSY